jgi:lipoprotein-releasing system ATP-binding protein
LAVEAGVATSWWRWVGGAGDVVSVDRFGASAPGARVLEEFGFSAANIASRARELLAAVGLADKAGRLAAQLSGGEQQRVAIARALANEPTAILADEPTGNLDAKNSTLVFELLTSLARQHGQAVVMVTHNPDLAARCDVTRTMRDGQFVS